MSYDELDEFGSLEEFNDRYPDDDLDEVVELEVPGDNLPEDDLPEFDVYDDNRWYGDYGEPYSEDDDTELIAEDDDNICTECDGTGEFPEDHLCKACNGKGSIGE